MPYIKGLAIMEHRKIFDQRGFLLPEAKSFVNDHFTQGLRRVLETAHSDGDVLIIASILHSIVGDIALEKQLDFKHKPLAEAKPIHPNTEVKPISPTEKYAKVIPFPGSRGSQELLSMLEKISEPPIEE